MFAPIVLTVLLVVANVAGVAMILPQVVRLRRVRTAAGVSNAWVGVGLAMNLWWLAYAAALGLWGLAPVAIGGAALYATMVAQLVGILGPAALAAIGRGHLIGLLPLGGLAADGWTGAGLVIGLLYGAVFAPAVWTALRSRDVAGIAATTWVLAWIEAVIWLAYGWTTGDVALTVGGLGGTVMSSVILLRLAVGPMAGTGPTGLRALRQTTESTSRAPRRSQRRFAEGESRGPGLRPGHAQLFFGSSLNGVFRSGPGSLGRPRVRSPRMLRWTWSDPP